MNVEHIPAEDVDMLPCGADWQSRHLESEKRKAEIRDRIHKQAEQGQKTAKDYFRPAKPTPSIYDSDLKRVAVYARVSTSSEEQISSIENQTLYYTKKIAETENWNLQDIYSDEGKSGTSLRKRDAFKRMMRDAKDQKMDLIICASISRFARNFSDCMTQIGYQSSTVLDEPEREAGTTSIPIPQREESENISLPDLPGQLENVQQSGNEIAERGMPT